MEGRPTVFISDSRADKAWKDRLVRHLHVPVRQGVLDIWDDSRITTGAKWRREIEQAMGHASVAILLVSADFLSSNFVLNAEVPRLLERQKKDGLHIIPILVAPCDWEAVEWLSAMQFHEDGQPISGRADHDIEKSLMLVAKETRLRLKSRAEEVLMNPGNVLPEEDSQAPDESKDAALAYKSMYRFAPGPDRRYTPQTIPEEASRDRIYVFLWFIAIMATGLGVIIAVYNGPVPTILAVIGSVSLAGLFGMILARKLFYIEFELVGKRSLLKMIAIYMCVAVALSLGTKGVVWLFMMIAES